MATRKGEEVTYELIDYKGQKARLYPDGSIRDSRGYFLDRHPAGANEITSANARSLASHRFELKRQVAQEAANAAVQRGDFKVQYGDMAFVAEIVDAAQAKATNIDDPKAIDAARFVLQVTGYDEKQAVEPDTGVVLSNETAVKLLELLSQVLPHADVVDVEPT